MTDPFQISNCSPNLIHIANGIVAEKHVEISLSNARNTGLNMLKKFVNSRLDSESNDQVSFYDTLKKSDLKTFTDMKKNYHQKIR